MSGGCRLCPRACGVDRARGAGRCRAPRELRLARAALHFWEEPPISGERGSGAIFFSGCPLGCVYCQNAPIARGEVGRTVSEAHLSEIMLELQEKGAHNINLVTPTHYRPAILRAAAAARAGGLTVPLVWNTSGYETPEAIDALSGAVDIFLTDFRYITPALAEKYSGAPDYPAVALAATDRMVGTAGPPVFGEDGLLRSGVIVRQLILPGHTREAMAITDLLHARYGDRVCLSLMNQYTPTAHLDRDAYPELARPLRAAEYERVVEHALSVGVTRGFLQEEGTAKESFIPAFDYEGL